MSKGIVYKTKEEIELIRISSLLVGKTLAAVASKIKPGITTSELDKIAFEFIQSNSAKPSFLGYREFPATLCISVNEEVVHGIPGKRVIRDGDLVSIDCGVFKNGYHGDSAYTFAVGEISDESRKLCLVTMECLLEGVKLAQPGRRLGDVSYMIQNIAESNNYGVVRELIGHGVGKNLHEKPDVPNYGKRGSGVVLQPGVVIAIEPMINAGKKQIKQNNDGWTITTSDLKPSAHYEHTVAIMEGGNDVLSSFVEIENAVSANTSLTKIF